MGTFFCDACADLNLKHTCAQNGCQSIVNAAAEAKNNVRAPNENAVRDISAAAFNTGLLDSGATPKLVRERLDAYDTQWAAKIPMRCLDKERAQARVYSLNSRPTPLRARFPTQPTLHAGCPGTLRWHSPCPLELPVARLQVMLKKTVRAEITLLPGWEDPMEPLHDVVVRTLPTTLCSG